MSMLDSAIAFAATAHAGQVRKYVNLPYIVHPIEVMAMVSHLGEDAMMAAVLHDVLEDTPVTAGTLRRRFGEAVTNLVLELTDVYTTQAYPEMNRSARKAAEVIRQSCMSATAQSIKYADLISNTDTIVKFDHGFARTYLREKEALLAVMVDGDEALRGRALRTLTEAQTVLLQERLKR